MKYIYPTTQKAHLLSVSEGLFKRGYDLSDSGDYAIACLSEVNDFHEEDLEDITVQVTRGHNTTFQTSRWDVDVYTATVYASLSGKIVSNSPISGQIENAYYLAKIAAEDRGMNWGCAYCLMQGDDFICRVPVYWSKTITASAYCATNGLYRTPEGQVKAASGSIWVPIGPTLAMAKQGVKAQCDALRTLRYQKFDRAVDIEYIPPTITPSFHEVLQEGVLRQGEVQTFLTGFDKEWLIHHAWYNAFEAVMPFNDNLYPTIAEIISILTSLCFNREKFLLEKFRSMADWASAWLGYRYAYCTTKMDVEQAYRAVERLVRGIDFNAWSNKCYGVAERVVSGENVRCIASATITPRNILGGDFLHRLWSLGLEPNAYVLWDMIPFSFIVDWILPTGDVAKVEADSKYYNDRYYDIVDTSTSFSYNVSGKDIPYHHVYSRVCDWYPAHLNGSLWYWKDNASDLTLTKRITDVGALAYGFARAAVMK